MSKEESIYISYSEILKILKIDISKPRYNPKTFDKVLRDIDKIEAIIGNRENSEEIVNLCQIGSFGLLRTLYP